jgi:predicted enzyme involved in methoxymalonyl-ACP biosynthesis
VVVAVEDGDVLDVDTWAMSCRVIGRTLERTVVAHLVDEARRRGLTTIRGTYLPTDRNALVAGLYGDLGFDRTGQDGEITTWMLDVPNETPRNEFIEEPAWAK